MPFMHDAPGRALTPQEVRKAANAAIETHYHPIREHTYVRQTITITLEINHRKRQTSAHVEQSWELEDAKSND